MGRRQLVVLISAAVMVLLGAGAVGALVVATQSDDGREWIRARLAAFLNRGLQGELKVGRLSGSFLTDLTIDTLELRDRGDSVFFAAGRVTVHYDPRDLLDGRIIIRSMDATNPFIVIRKELDTAWNYNKVFAANEGPRPVSRLTRTAFGARVMLHNVRVRGGHIQLTKPWRPADSLRADKRDSAIAFNLADTYNDIERVTLGGQRGFQKTWRWKDIDATFSRIRWRHPDSTGRRFTVARLDMTETVPPFRFREMRGEATWRGDTAWFDMPHFRLPGSVGSIKGSVEWPINNNMYWDVRVRGDTVALTDIHWIYPTLPTVGSGSMDLRILTRRENHEVTDYVITNMDVRSRGSRLVGDMTYRVGGPVLEVRDVALALRPANFILFETLNGVPFPYAWKGDVTGTVLASGGPVNRFKVERADLAFEDHNVPGATAKGVGRGELDILFPAFAKFHGFELELDHFDLRTGQFLNPLFPRLDGRIGGTAVLDSVWLDVRVRDADLVHRDGDDVAPTRVRGAARVTLGDDFVTVDAAGTALPLSMDAMAKSYPMLPLRGEYSGTMRAQGTIADLAYTADLSGPAGRVQVDGRFDGFEPTFGAVARATLSSFDLRTGLGNPALPTSELDARITVDLRGDSLATLAGTAQVQVDRSVVDSVRVFGGQATMRFGGRLLRVDSLRLESTAAELRAAGGLGLSSDVTDSLGFRVTVDSLGGLRRYLARTSADSLAGGFRVLGALTGQLSRFAVDAALDGGDGLRIRDGTARGLRAAVSLSGLPDSATGAVTARLDGVRVGTSVFPDVDLRADVGAGRQAYTRAAIVSGTGATMRATAAIERLADSGFVVRLDSLAARTASNTWRLQRPSRFTLVGRGLRVDTLALAGLTGGRIDASGRNAGTDSIALGIRASNVPLADLGEVLQVRSPLSGLLTGRAELRGTRAQPDLFYTASLSEGRLGPLGFDALDADGRYANRRLTTSMGLRRGGRPALHADASLPLDLSLDAAGSRLLEEPLTAHIRTDSAGLALLESFVPAVRDASGTMDLDLALGGTWRHPRATGLLSVRDGRLRLAPMGNVALSGVRADIGFLGDSIVIRELSARDSTDAGKTAQVSGTIGIRDIADPSFALGVEMQRFTVVDDPRLARLDLTGNARLSGRRSGSVLAGDGFTVERGEIRLTELYQKRVIAVDELSISGLADTTAAANVLAAAAGDTLLMNNLTVQNVPIRMGPDVWLRSEEANIALGGFVNVTRGRPQRGGGARQQLLLEGPLQTVRGTYRLNLGLVQRTFAVEGGEVRFYGDPDLNATLNINALHVVRQIGQQGARPDVRVRVHIGGTRLAPTAELSSPDSIRVTTGDLISYLTTGGPSSEISGRGNDYTSTATRALLTSVGSVLSGKAVSGGLCDDAQLSTAGLDAYWAGGSSLRDVSGRVLQGTRFNCARQLSDRLFVRLDAGLCQVGELVGSGSATSTAPSFADTFGAKVDYRMSRDLTLSLGVEPPTSAVFCRTDAGARGFAPTPRQIGLDLFRFWRF
ncbi:MAG: hypothetical protein FJ202_00665 [Gemmatimonadetes bacterium]|nr:hypothetical protein [Gemmatimonadota bacterium]